MSLSVRELAEKHCTACEGKVAPYSADEAEAQVRSLAGWELSDDARRIAKRWRVADFMAGVEFFQRIAEVAESEDHHPDLHLEGYRNVRVELSTHAIGGLSDNDFILAAKIDQLPVRPR